MKIKMLPYAVCGLVLLLSGCATTPKITTEAKAGVDFGRYHTFLLTPLAVTGPTSDPGLVLRLAEPLAQAANEVLISKGFTPAAPPPADFSVNLRCQTIPRVRVTDWGYQPAPTYYGRGGRYYGRGLGGYRDVDIRNYQEHTLTIEVFDHQLNKLAWVGWCRHEATGALETAKSEEMTRAILAEFPPSQK